MMTPDSSRYWPKDTYAPGGPQPSFDKQYVRDYLESIKWNKQPPVPSLPADVVAQHARQVSGRLPPPDRAALAPRPRRSEIAACISCSSSSSREMVDKGIHYEDAQREFEKRFITARDAEERRQSLQGRRHARRAPQHAGPEDQGTEDQGAARSAILGPPVDGHGTSRRALTRSASLAYT